MEIRTRGMWLRAVVVCAALAVTGCATNIADVPDRNIVMVSKNGRLVNPNGNGSFLGYSHWRGFNYDPLDDDDEHFCADEWITRVVDEVEATPAVERWGDTTRTVKRVTIFIHGGLNDQVSTIERATKLKPRMADDPTVGCPVFVNWPSSLRATYIEHLMLVRDGREGSRTFGYLTAPFVLLTDVLTAVARAPVVWTYSIRRVLIGREGERADDAAAERTQSGEATNVHSGEDETGTWYSIRDTTGLVLWAPVRFLTAPIVDAFGRPAWNNMKRRTTMMFHDKREFRRSAPHVELEPPHLPNPQNPSQDLAFGAAQGDLTRFFLHLQAEMDREYGRDGWEITLIGHSMGTIVANSILTRFPDLPVENVVYMAAACSVQDYHGAVFPLLQRRPSARMWNLVLQRDAEVAETFPGLIELAPRGSLLVWIDSFYESPETWLDRTAGRFTNLLATEHLSKGVDDVRGLPIRDRIVVKEFDHRARRDPDNPEMHGDFSTAPFWERSFWTPGPQVHGSDPR